MVVNKVVEIVERLDGYSDTGLAFALTEIKKVDGMYHMTVTPYNKDGEEVTEEQHAKELVEMARRLSGYGDTIYVIIHAELLACGEWDLKVKCYEKKNSEEEQ